jgi:hypothetical protein
MRLTFCFSRSRMANSEASLSLEEQLQPFAPAQPAYWSEIPCHFGLSFLVLRHGAASGDGIRYAESG